MPRPPRFRIAAIADLHRQLAFAPTEARRRHMDATERLLAQIDPRRSYPEEFVVYRVTGFRPERADPTSILVGEPLVADLSTFVLRLSETLALAPGDRPGGAAPLTEVAQRLGLSPRTVQRWRRLGLPLHWIDFEDGRRVGCYESALAEFRARRPDAAGVAGRRRVDAAERAAVIEAARQEREGDPALSPSAAAQRLALRFGRSHETIRLILERHDARARTPIFAARARLDERDRRLVERAWRRGVPLRRVAAHLARSEPAIHRQLMVRRREHLAGLPLEWIELPTFSLPDAERVILGAASVRSGLVHLVGATDAIELLALARGSAPGRAQEAIEERAAARHFLLRRAAAAIAALPAVPRASELDRIETDLRWAALLQQTLLLATLATAARRLDAWAGRPAEGLSGEELRAGLTLAIEVGAEVVQRFDPSAAGRLDRLAALAIDKALARSPAPGRGRAAVHGSRQVPIGDRFAGLAPWQPFLDPPAGWRRGLDRLAPGQRTAIVRHHGLDGARPSTIAEIARELRTSAPGVARLLGEAVAGLRLR